MNCLGQRVRSVGEESRNFAFMASGVPRGSSLDLTRSSWLSMANVLFFALSLCSDSCKHVRVEVSAELCNDFLNCFSLRSGGHVGRHWGEKMFIFLCLLYFRLVKREYQEYSMIGAIPGEREWSCRLSWIDCLLLLVLQRLMVLMRVFGPESGNRCSKWWCT